MSEAKKANVLLEYKNVGKCYAGQLEAVKNFSLKIAAGETVVFIGPSGCGKTTTLRMTNRLVEPTSGQITLAGVDTSTIDPTQLRRSMGYVIQGIGLFPHMTIWENIATVPRLKGIKGKELNGVVESCLELMELSHDEYAHKYPHELSGGQQQRVGVARALAGNPDLILMDEPFGALDPLVRETLQNELIRIKEQLSATIIFVTHDIHEAIKMGDRIVIMKEGETVQVGSPLTLLAKPANDFVSDFVGAKDMLAQFRYLLVSDIETHDIPPQIRLDSTVGAARRILGRHGAAASPLVCTVDESGTLIGCVDTSLPYENDRPAEECLMIFPDITEESTVYDALSAMVGNNTTCIPVQDGSGKPIGMISLGSMHDYIWKIR